MVLNVMCYFLRHGVLGLLAYLSLAWCKSKVGHLYRGSLRSDICRAALQYSPCSLDPMPAATLRRISMKALARYQIILLGEQRHIMCEQLAQGCCPNSAATGVEPATSRVSITSPAL